jgi:hypothetical protein
MDRLDEIITSPSFDYLEQEDYSIVGCEGVYGGGNLPTFQVCIMKIQGAGLYEIQQISFILHDVTSYPTRWYSSCSSP